MLGDDLEERGFHIGGHALGIAAQVKDRALFHGTKERSTFLTHPVLNVYFFVAVPRESRVQVVQIPISLQTLQTALIDKIGRLVAITEEKPVFPLASLARRSSRKAIKGAIPVPGPIMIVVVS